MKIVVDESCERLSIGPDEFWSNGDNLFEVVASRFQDARLSDIPRGVSIKLCERVVGSSELIGRGSSRFEHTAEGSFVAHAETAFFVEDETVEATARQQYLNAALADGKKALRPFSQNGTLIDVSESVYEDVAYLSYSLKLVDQLIFDAEACMDEIEQNVRDVLEQSLIAVWERAEPGSPLAGGQGKVIKVRRRSDGHFGALKRLHPVNQRDKERRARAYREVDALEIMEGKGAPMVLESNAASWKDKNVDLYVIMEWIEGPTLLERISHKRLSLDEALVVTLALLNTLERAHRLEIFHRDLKPDNVILRGGNLSDPVLVDFGMSWSRPPENDDHTFETETGQELGNRFLRLPEYAAGRNVRDNRSDLTMLVGLFFFLISGRFPRQLSDENGKMPHERDALPEQLTTDSRSPRLRRLLRLGFQSSLDDRFQSPNQLRLALEGLTGGQQSDPVADALQRLEDVRLSDDVRRRRLAKEHFQAAHEQIIRILSSVDPDNTGLEHRVSAGLTSEGRTADLQSQFFRRAGGLRDIMLEHRLRLDSNSYVASVRVLDNNSDLNLEDWWEYYRGPAGDLDLLLAAITDAAHLALAKVIDAYGEAMGKLRDVDPSIEI